jgi:multiple sugar transport system substrate-binding protein
MPDVIVEDRPQLPDRAKNNIETSLGEMAKADNIDSKLFWPFTWEQATVDGQPYGLPYETDIRVLYWNKAAFKDAGLDPEKPPANWDDLWSYADKLDQKTGDKLERVGFHPLFGNMDLDQWAWNDGGQWMDPKTKKFTLNDKHNVETLDWIKKWSDRYGKANWEAFRGTFGQGNQDGFMSGRVAMMVDIAGYTSFLNFFNPNLSTKDKERLGWGVAPIPPAPGHQPASLSGGFALSIPRGAKNPKPAWEFIKYAVFQGQASWARDTYSIPTIEKLAKEDPTLNGDPNWQFFVKAMDYGRAGDFNPYYPRWSDLLGPARDAVLDGKMTSQQALDEAQQKAEAEARRNGAPD